MIHRNGNSTPLESPQAPQTRGHWDVVEPFARKRTSKTKNYVDSATGLSVREMLMELGGDKAITRPYLQSPWVYACVSARARAIAAHNLVFQRVERDGQRRDLDTSDPLVQLFRRPNPIVSQRMFLRHLENNQCLWGETFLLCLDRNRKPVKPIRGIGLESTIPVPAEIWTVPGHMVEIVGPQDRMPKMYRIHYGSSGSQEVDAAAIIPITDVNPYSTLRGVGPVTPILREAAKGYILDAYDEAMLQNGGVPSGLLSSEGALTQDEMTAMRDAWQEAYNRPAQTRRTAVLPKGLKYQQLGLSQQDMEFESMRRWSRDTIMAALGVTKPIIAISEDVNRANAREAYKVFWDTTIGPEADFFEDQLQNRMLRRFEGYEGVEVNFDSSGVAALRDDIGDKIKRTMDLYQGGQRSFSEAAQLAGWDLSEYDLVGTDERWVPLNLVPVEYALAVGHPATPGQSPEEITADDEEIEPQPNPFDDDGDEDIPVEEEDEEEERALDALTKAEFEEERDEVYGKWKKLANMTATQLKTWAKNECSRKASLNPAAVIKRNLNLLETPKADWTSRHVKSANRAINFISRMKGNEQGEPAAEGCPSKRDISLRNWAHNPGGKISASCDHDHDTRVLMDEDQARALWDRHDKFLTKHEVGFEKRVNSVFRGFILSVRNSARDLSKSPIAASAPESTVRYIPSIAEIERALLGGFDKHQQDMVVTVQRQLRQVIDSAAQQMHLQLGEQGDLVTAMHPKMLQFVGERSAFVETGFLVTVSAEMVKAIRDAVTNNSGTHVNLAGALAEAMPAVEDVVEQTLGRAADRAAAIARTEVNAAVNVAQMQQMRNDGVRRHQWLTQRDALVRDSHAQLDGLIRATGEEFGFGLHYPGDPAAGPDQTVNCRCVTIPVRENE